MDIKLTESNELTASKTGEALVTTNNMETLLQDIRLESVTQEGELFYDESYGWSLLDFMQRSSDELDIIELEDRVKTKLAVRDEIDAKETQVEVVIKEDSMLLLIKFTLRTGAKYSMEIDLYRVEVIME